MPSPALGYEIDGKSIPSVTTVIGVGLGGYSKDNLMAWAWKEGKEGRDYKQTRDKAADVGTVAHARIEAFLQTGHDIDWSHYDHDLIVKSDPCLRAFKTWYAANDIAVHEQEISLISKQYRYGGTIDARITLNGRMCLADWKSSKAIYGTMAVQVAAYHALLRENRPRHKWPEHAVIVRVGKDGTLRVVDLSMADLAYGFKVFTHALAVYHARYDLDRMVRAPIEIDQPRTTQSGAALTITTERIP